MHMRDHRATTFLAILGFLLLSTAAATALDIGIEGWLGDLGFATDRKVTDTTFPGYDKLFWGVSLYGTQAVTDDISFLTGFYSDPVLRNTTYTLFSYSTQFFTIGFGPFFGLFNSTSTLLKSGISTSVKLELPGIIFASFRSDSSIGGELVQVGDYMQTRNDISFGVHLPNAICTLSLDSSSFEQKSTAALDIVDSLTVYSFSTDIYKKNIPYRLIVTVSYQSLVRSYISTAVTESSLNSVVLGMETNISLSPSVLLTAGIEGNLYSFGMGTLVGSAEDFLFQTSLGLQIGVDSIPFLAEIL
jgi:hypothetical protein